MLRQRAHVRLAVASALASLTLFTASAYGQSPATQPATSGDHLAPPQGPRVSNPAKKVAEGSRTSDLENEVTAMRAENAAVREQLRKMEEHQRATDEEQKRLLNLLEQLQQRLNGTAARDANIQPGQSEVLAVGSNAPAPATDAVNAPLPPASPPAKQDKDDDHYKDGIVIWQTNDDARVPFLLKFTNTTQFRYLNSLGTNTTFTDHLGNVREVTQRNDLTVNREMFTLGGYIYDKRLSYGVIVWTSATTTQVIVTGNIGWRFNKALTLHAGYWSVPGSRSLTGTFPFFVQPERTLADNFFRPGFTQGVWATGEPIKGLNYNLFLGNGLNTLGIAQTKVDTHLMFAGSVWWEPLGTYGEPGKSRNAYDDYAGLKKTRVRIGTSFTSSREDRFSNLDQRNPENVSMYNSDGVLTFSTGAFAPNVTVEEAQYRMLAIDGGVKRNGFALNGQYYFRWVDDFEADGPLPLTSMFDNGFEVSVSKFVVPRKLMVYGRGSAIFGQFGNSHEYAGGFKWFFLPTDSLWLTGELLKVQRASVGSSITPYSAGATGWVPMVQTIVTW